MPDSEWHQSPTKNVCRQKSQQCFVGSAKSPLHAALSQLILWSSSLHIRALLQREEQGSSTHFPLLAFKSELSAGPSSMANERSHNSNLFGCSRIWIGSPIEPSVMLHHTKALICSKYSFIAWSRNQGKVSVVRISVTQL